MDVQICIQDEVARYTSGDSVVGKVHIYCAQPTTVSKFTVALIGESVSSLTGASGLLFSRRQEEAHVFLREEYCILASPSGASRTPETRSIRLGIGCNSFGFRLRVPWAQTCSSCPPNTPVEDGCYQDFTEHNLIPDPRRQLPPSSSGLQRGNWIAYRVDVSVSTMRNMFKTRTVKVY